MNKMELHIDFWRGDGPCLILIPPFNEALYDLRDYPSRFHNPQLMWESEIRRARAVIDWPTDGIPTVRPNLGVITIPGMAGQSYKTPEDSMPWPGEPLTEGEIREIANQDLTASKIFNLVSEFYRINKLKGEEQIYPYLPDTQGVFDIAHLLYGNDIFLSVLNNETGSWFNELMDISLGLYINATKAFKDLLNERPNSMVHGHGTEQGVYFPGSGVRVAEDTAILLSPEIIEESIIQFIKKSVESYGGGFLHFCGYHPTIFYQFSQLSCIKAIDLGNPEKYDLKWILEKCAETDTVLYSRVAAEPGETWKSYVKRIASLTSGAGARVILRPTVFPSTFDECNEMRLLWHELTS